MKFYLGVTDNRWYTFLSKISPEDVNFWQPGGSLRFRAIEPGAPFLFKLKSPINAIGGIGFLSSHTFLPVSVAWDAFKNRNGCDSLVELRNMILSYRSDKLTENPNIGCIVLTNPIFFKEEDWIETPSNWSNPIMSGKTYDTSEIQGKSLWTKVEETLEKYWYNSSRSYDGDGQFVFEPESPQYGNSILSRIRIGQGAFRVLVIDAYSRKCSISGEKTLPVLEAAHILPYSESDPNSVSNGLLLRSDLHKLFDGGYLTITTDYKVEVSSRIKAEFENGREYYKFHGQDLLMLPDREKDRPKKVFIELHNETVFRS